MFKKYRLHVLIAIILPLMVTGLYFILQSHSTINDVSMKQPLALPQGKPITEPETQSYIRISALGDMLPHDTVNLRAKTQDGYNYLPFFDKVKSYINAQDIVFCNQESPSAGVDFGIPGYPTFNAPIQFSKDLNTFGCNVINLANNHIADKGQAGINKTLSVWNDIRPLSVTGANGSISQQDTIKYFEKDGKKFAFLAFTDLTNNKNINTYSVNMFNEALVTKSTTEAKAKSDYVIVSAHWGVEDSPDISQSQIKWATLLADSGANLIIGTGPHVLQPANKIGDTIVFYSIGNFLSTQLQIEELVGGIAHIDIPIDGGTPVLSFLPTFMNYTWSADDRANDDYLKRDNLSVNPLYKSAELIKDSLFETSMDAQMSRIDSTLNTYIKVNVLKFD